jgi:hypothetical protein
VLAQRPVPVVSRAYEIVEITRDAAPGAPGGSGYRDVHLRHR